MRFPVWIAADGWRHRAYDWPADGAPRGSLIFQSGRADFIEKYLEACDHWHRGGWAVEGFDWRGQGGSRRFAEGLQPDDRLSFDPLIDDLVAFVADWKARTPAPHVLVAHSMGGHVALRACAERGMVLDALVLVAPMLALNTGFIPRPIAQMLIGGARLAGLGHRAAWTDDPDDPRRQFRLTASRERYEDSQWWKTERPGMGLGTPTWNWLGAAMAGARRIGRRGALARVTTPVLLLAAGFDKLVRDSAIEAAAWRLPVGEFRLLPTARHEMLREADDNRLPALAAIDDFLARRAPRP
ncbi:alpha/beta fold hydrolase [Sphingomonas abietis]|uniref:Alpha/beta hydrolase n=1 Tax=Sphingomonas abietis TaxID=3012344 RepID=A0ABY7NVM6_9SPHN|nr:alpha/beta hydrolase [Sphingomonas abietis]WBO23496.1 alpha/beta hydrolase [Sphingomonas abietis]